MLTVDGPDAKGTGVDVERDLRKELSRIVANEPALGRARQAIADSWARAVALGLHPGRLVMPCSGAIDELSPLLGSATSVVDRLADDLSGTETSVVLVDADGLVVLRRVPNGSEEKRLDEVMLRPGYRWSFKHAGTNGLSDALATGVASVAAGSEHFLDALTGITSAGAPIRNPRTGRVIGVLGLVCEAPAANSLLLPMASRAAREVEQNFLHAGTGRDRALEEAFLRARRGSRSPVAVVSPGGLITNTAAARLLASEDQPHLWRFVSLHVKVDRKTECRFVLTDGRPLEVSLEAVRAGDDVVGVILRALAPSVPSHRQAFGWESLTSAERTVTDLVSEGLTNRQMANQLCLSPHTIDAHLRHIFQKLGINSRVELVRIAIAETWSGPGPVDAAAVA